MTAKAVSSIHLQEALKDWEMPEVGALAAETGSSCLAAGFILPSSFE